MDTDPDPRTIRCYNPVTYELEEVIAKLKISIHKWEGRELNHIAMQEHLFDSTCVFSQILRRKGVVREAFTNAGAADENGQNEIMIQPAPGLLQQLQNFRNLPTEEERLQADIKSYATQRRLTFLKSCQLGFIVCKIFNVLEYVSLSNNPDDFDHRTTYSSVIQPDFLKNNHLKEEWHDENPKKCGYKFVTVSKKAEKAGQCCACLQALTQYQQWVPCMGGGRKCDNRMHVSCLKKYGAFSRGRCLNDIICLYCAVLFAHHYIKSSIHYRP